MDRDPSSGVEPKATEIKTGVIIKSFARDSEGEGERIDFDSFDVPSSLIRGLTFKTASP